MTFETAEQKEERIYQHLTEARVRIEQDMHAISDVNLKRIAADAALSATLAIIMELLPARIRAHVQAICDLHEEAWCMNTSSERTTPRKLLGRYLRNKISSFTRAHSEGFERQRRSASVIRPSQ